MCQHDGESAASAGHTLLDEPTLRFTGLQSWSCLLAAEYVDEELTDLVEGIGDIDKLCPSVRLISRERKTCQEISIDYVALAKKKFK